MTLTDELKILDNKIKDLYLLKIFWKNMNI